MIIVFHLIRYFFKKYFRNIFLIEDIPSNKKNIDVIINPNYEIKKKIIKTLMQLNFFRISYKLIKEIKFEKKKRWFYDIIWWWNCF